MLSQLQPRFCLALISSNPSPRDSNLCHHFLSLLINMRKIQREKDAKQEIQIRLPRVLKIYKCIENDSSEAVMPRARRLGKPMATVQSQPWVTTPTTLPPLSLDFSLRLIRKA